MDTQTKQMMLFNEQEVVQIVNETLFQLFLVQKKNFLKDECKKSLCFT